MKESIAFMCRYVYNTYGITDFCHKGKRYKKLEGNLWLESNQEN